MKIAQRFNAGMDATRVKVPKGRLKDGATPYTFGRPFGTQILPTFFPALKRRATLALSLRDSGSRYDPGISDRNSAQPDWRKSAHRIERFPRRRRTTEIDDHTRAIAESAKRRNA